MSLNTNDRSKVERTAEANGYKWNSDASKMINGSKSAAFSSSGSSVNVNSSSNSVGSANRSKKW